MSLSCNNLAGETVCRDVFPKSVRVAEALDTIKKGTCEAATLILPSNYVLGIGDHHLALWEFLESPTKIEKRLHRDGISYTKHEFFKYYGL